MKKENTYLIGLASLALVGFLVYFSRRARKEVMLERLEKIADEGYELAQDVLYPLSRSRTKNSPYSMALPKG